MQTTIHDLPRDHGHGQRCMCALCCDATEREGRITLDWGCDFNDDGSVTERGSGVVIIPADRDVIPAAQGPLPEIGTKAMGRLMDRCQNAGLQGFSSATEAADVAGWWARIHGLRTATIHRDRSGRIVIWE